MENSIKTCEISLTQEEAETFALKVSELLETEMVREGPNIVTIEALNKVYKALSGSDHRIMGSESFKQLTEAFNLGQNGYCRTYAGKVRRESRTALIISITIDGEKKELSLTNFEESWVGLEMSNVTQSTTDEKVANVVQKIYNATCPQENKSPEATSLVKTRFPKMY